MEKIAYVVTETAGPKVAGRRVSPGQELLLTEFEARAELLAGSLRRLMVETQPVTEAPIAAAEETTDTADAAKKKR